MTHKGLFGTGVVLALAAALALFGAGGGASLAEDGIIYVDVDAPGPTHDGSSWAFAHTGLQDALADAAPGDQIWVAAGTYKPSVEHGGSGDRYWSFQMVNEVAIYGGFAGGETELGQRDWAANSTILSGEIGVGGDATDNAYHVFYHPDGANLDGTAILDGFTITGGNADGDVSPHWNGGGMYNSGSSPTLANLTFTGNSASNWGGGMLNGWYSSPTLTNCTFEGNSAAYAGGGMYNLNNSAPTLTNCTLYGNSASFGGGMYNGYSSPELTSCTFTGNWAANGGGIYNYDSSPTLTNCTFSGNSADLGGGMHNRWYSSPSLTNCTITGNSADLGGGMFNDYNSSPVLTNCISWGDTAGEIVNYDSSCIPAVTYSDVQGGYTGTGNIDVDPLFVDPDNGNLRLQLTSPAIDAGNNEAPGLACITTDLGGHPRFIDVLSVPDNGNGDPPIVDMGAYEAPLDVIYVDPAATGASDGTSWLNAFTDLQAALDLAVAPVQLWVAQGTYVPTWQFDAGDPRSAAFQMVNGVAIYGGFDPSAGDDTWEERDGQANPTILSGDIGAPDDPSDNSYHVFYHPDGTSLDSTAILDGFTITGGNANGDASPYWDGGGMYNDGSSPTLANLTFTGNSASWGAGLYNNDNSEPVLTNCTFSGNAAVAEGGGIFNSLSSPALTNCTFSGNSASSAGGMLNGWYSSPTLTNCILWGDASPEISNSEDSAPVVSYSDIQGGCDADPYNVCGDGNIDDDPLFVDAANGNVHLGPGSPCIDAGYNAVVSSLLYDFDGHPRIMDGDRDGTATVDMGVDEVFGHQVYLPLVLRNY